MLQRRRGGRLACALQDNLACQPSHDGKQGVGIKCTPGAWSVLSSARCSQAQFRALQVVIYDVDVGQDPDSINPKECVSAGWQGA